LHNGLFFSITNCVDAGFVGTAKRAGYMATTAAGAIATSEMSDDHDLAFDFDLDIDAAEYSRIMRRIGVDGDETVAPISVFYPSI
jgi:hypothetical protein